ncbi:MAG: hypothetical protein CL612_03950 [Anaerolineaceae bacterium]|jgi:hypothetical protein|nr:hypothetical protein [Anaerolineaceae bacterium]|tara:strand:- start:2277 stop:2627 length:351 start_codon:yes stop_codon:yes gene_type:complete
MGKLIALLFLVMWTVQLIHRAANSFIQWQRGRFSGSDEESWKIIEPAQRDDGTPIKAALSQIEKARQVFNGSTNGKNVRGTGELETNFRHLGLKILIGVTAIALLVTIPILIVAFR